MSPFYPVYASAAVIAANAQSTASMMFGAMSFADDGRVTVATISDTGRDVFRAAAPGHVANIRRLVFDRLEPDDAVTLGAIMAKLVPAEDPHDTLRPLARWFPRECPANAQTLVA